MGRSFLATRRSQFAGTVRLLVHQELRIDYHAVALGSFHLSRWRVRRGAGVIGEILGRSGRGAVRGENLR